MHGELAIACCHAHPGKGGVGRGAEGQVGAHGGEGATRLGFPQVASQPERPESCSTEISSPAYEYILIYKLYEKYIPMSKKFVLSK